MGVEPGYSSGCLKRQSGCMTRFVVHKYWWPANQHVTCLSFLIIESAEALTSESLPACPLSLHVRFARHDLEFGADHFGTGSAPAIMVSNGQFGLESLHVCQLIWLNISKYA